MGKLNSPVFLFNFCFMNYGQTRRVAVNLDHPDKLICLGMPPSQILVGCEHTVRCTHIPGEVWTIRDGIERSKLALANVDEGLARDELVVVAFAVERRKQRKT